MTVPAPEESGNRSFDPNIRPPGTRRFSHRRLLEISYDQVDTHEPDGNPVTEWSVEEIFGADHRTFSDLRPAPPEQRPKRAEIFSVDDLDLSHLEPEFRGRVYAMLRKHERMWDGSLGTIEATYHRIEVRPCTRPVRQRAYRAGRRAPEVERAEVTRMLEHKVIRPSQSEWASPVVLAPKSDGSMRFCFDYRRLHAVTKRNSYPLPRMDECIDFLGSAKVFSCLDANWGY